MKCSEKTKAGKPCKRDAKKGEKKCPSHLGTAKRPLKLKQAQPKVVEALELGNSREGSARYAGISPATFYSWMERGELALEQSKPDQFAEFLDAITRAEGIAEQTLVAEIRRASVGFVDPETRQRKGADWRAASFLLERRFPDRWGRHDKMEHSGAVRREPVDVPDDQLRMDEVTEHLREIGAVATEEGAGA